VLNRCLIVTAQSVKDSTRAQRIGQWMDRNSGRKGSFEDMRGDVYFARGRALKQIATVQSVLIIYAIGAQDSALDPVVNYLL
jgi:hypothetical protein